MQVLGSYLLEKYQTEKFEPIIYAIYHNKRIKEKIIIAFALKSLRQQISIP